jgi:hypothetical protein
MDTLWGYPTTTPRKGDNKIPFPSGHVFLFYFYLALTKFGGLVRVCYLSESGFYVLSLFLCFFFFFAGQPVEASFLSPDSSCIPLAWIFVVFKSFLHLQKHDC